MGPLTPEQAATELRDIEAAVDALAAALAQRRPARGPAQDRRQAIDIVLTCRWTWESAGI